MEDGVVKVKNQEGRSTRRQTQGSIRVLRTTASQRHGTAVFSAAYVPGYFKMRRSAGTWEASDAVSRQALVLSENCTLGILAADTYS